ncbi:MAG: hypothetical protein R3F65_18545 [bacterium]
MATTLDLAAEYDLSPDAIERWLREHGLGKPKGHLSSKAERAFRDAHDKHRSVAQWFVTPHRQSAPLTSPAHNPATNPATRVDNPAITNHYKHKHDQLLDGYRGVVAERDAARAAVETLGAEVARLTAALEAAEAGPKRKRVPAAEPAPAAPAAEPLRAALEATGLFGDELRRALRAFVADDKRCDALLAQARLEDIGLVASLAPVCPDPTCREVASLDGKVAVDVTATRCVICHNSDNRRAWLRMARACVRATRTKLLIVGGAEDSHAHVNQLTALTPELDVSLVDGTSSQTRQRARSKVRGADLVVIWSSTQLDHTVSDVYKSEADAFPRALRVMVREGGRGIKALAEDVVTALNR